MIKGVAITHVAANFLYLLVLETVPSGLASLDDLGFEGFVGTGLSVPVAGIDIFYSIYDNLIDLSSKSPPRDVKVVVVVVKLNETVAPITAFAAI